MPVHPRHSSTGAPLAVVAVAVVVSFGCSGQIGDDAAGNAAPPAGKSGTQAKPAGPSAPGATPAVLPRTPEGTAATAGRACAPGFVGVHRLNKREYANTLRDLLGVSPSLAAPMPDDALTGGFDTNAAATGANAEIVQAYLDIAERAVVQATAAGRLITCAPARRDFADDCVTRTVTSFAQRAYRRPLDDGDRAELRSLYTAVAASATDDREALSWTLVGVLTAPRFVYRSIAPPPSPATPSPSPRAIDAFEYAARLSYFLWGTMPDEPLMELARGGKLADAQVIASETRRMLKDARARELAVNFGEQWLDTRGLAAREFNLSLYPGLTRDRLASMLNETATFVQHVLTGDRRADDLVNADYTFVNRALASVYGVDVKSDTFVQTSLPRAERRGVLTQASVLAATSHPDRVSVPGRGMWIMENLLCLPPPPPPPESVDVSAVKKSGSALTLRQRFEMHRSAPACRACHEVMDNLGFALDNYGPTGAYRTVEDGKPIDARGVLPDGRSFASAVDLAGLIGARDDFARCLTVNLLSYGLGRVPSDQDLCAADRIAGEAAKAGASASDLIGKIVAADSFRSQSSGEASP